MKNKGIGRTGPVFGSSMSLLQKSFRIITANAGIQFFQCILDNRVRRDDGCIEFCKSLSIFVIGSSWCVFLKSSEESTLMKEVSL